MTKNQVAQFNKMLGTLKRISKEYQTPEKLRKSSRGQFGLDYDEALEMAYENIQNDASLAIKGIKSIPELPGANQVNGSRSR